MRNLSPQTPLRSLACMVGLLTIGVAASTPVTSSYLYDVERMKLDLTAACWRQHDPIEDDPEVPDDPSSGAGSGSGSGSGPESACGSASESERD